MIGLIGNIGLLTANSFDLQEGQIEIFDICAGIAIADPELMEFFAFLLGCGDVFAKPGVIIRHTGLLADLGGDHGFARLRLPG